MLWVQLVWTTGISESSIAYTGVIPTWKFTCELWHGRWKLAIHVLCELPLNDCWWGENRGLATLGTHMKSSSFIYINRYNMLSRQHNKTVACISLQHGCYLGSKQAILSLTSIPLYPFAHAERGNEPGDKGYPINTMKLLTDGFHGAWLQFWRVRARVCTQCIKIQARKPYIYHSSAEKK